MPKENNFQVPNFPTLGQSNTQSPGMPHLAFPGLPGFNPFLPPDLKALQQDLQRFSDLQKLYAQNESDQSSCQKYDSDSEIHRNNESMMDTGNRKRKSQNPTKRPHLEMEDNDHISSDSASDEGFPDPMMEDDDDDLDNVSSGDEAAWTDSYVLLYSVHSLQIFKFAKQFASQVIIIWSSDFQIVFILIICLIDYLIVRSGHLFVRLSDC